MWNKIKSDISNRFIDDKTRPRLPSQRSPGKRILGKCSWIWTSLKITLNLALNLHQHYLSHKKHNATKVPFCQTLFGQMLCPFMCTPNYYVSFLDLVVAGVVVQLDLLVPDPVPIRVILCPVLKTILSLASRHSQNHCCIENIWSKPDRRAA